jgi:hypothetical protein
MSEIRPNMDEYDFDNPDMQLGVEYGGYHGRAKIMKLGDSALKWHISISVKGGPLIAYWEGPDVVGDGPIIPSIDDIERAQHEINEAISQYMWDPMSQM